MAHPHREKTHTATQPKSFGLLLFVRSRAYIYIFSLHDCFYPYCVCSRSYSRMVFSSLVGSLAVVDFPSFHLIEFLWLGTAKSTHHCNFPSPTAPTGQALRQNDRKKTEIENFNILLVQWRVSVCLCARCWIYLSAFPVHVTFIRNEKHSYT